MPGFTKLFLHFLQKYVNDFLQKELENVQISCFDMSENMKYTAYFDTLKYEIYVIEE